MGKDLRCATAGRTRKSDVVPPNNKPTLTDSERAALDEIRAEREFERISKERRKARFNRVSDWLKFGAAVLVLKGLLWDSIKSAWEFGAAHWK